ncbi:MAG: DUF308 domain-containing protein [Bacilli bacterium]|nr:DUF308 domain-containing protein [Bacilli bacterium]
MNSFTKKGFTSSIITSIILAVLGILLIVATEATIISISYIIGGILILLGFFGLVDYIRKIDTETKTSVDLVYGIVTVILGVLIVMNPKAIASIINYVLGIIIVISSAVKLNYAIQLKGNNNSLWKSTIIFSLITTICGLILIFKPFTGAIVATKIIGIIVLIYAILNIISTFTIRKEVLRLHKALTDANNEKITREAEVVEETEETPEEEEKVEEDVPEEETPEEETVEEDTSEDVEEPVEEVEEEQEEKEEEKPKKKNNKKNKENK